MRGGPMASGRGAEQRDDSRASATDIHRKTESNLEKVPPFDQAAERELIEGAASILQRVQQGAGLSSTEMVEEAERIIYAISDKRTSNDAHSMAELMSSALVDAEKVQLAKSEGREIESPALPTHFV